MDTHFVESLYHERQEPGSMLCAQHALNNLVQAPMFSVEDMGGIAQELDRLEAAQLDAGTMQESHNFDDTGYFSVMVIEEALKVLGLRLVRWSSPEMRSARDKPESLEGFILNHQLHWYSIRRFAIAERFYNLDSCVDKPQWISPMYLGLTLREAEIQGYSIFVVMPLEESNVVGLPACDAADLAQTLPPPTSRGDGVSSSNAVSLAAGTSKFAGAGQTLGSVGNGTASPSNDSASVAHPKGKGKVSSVDPNPLPRPPPQPPALTSRLSSKRTTMHAVLSSDDDHTNDEDDDDVIIVDHSASASSVEEEKGRRHHERSRQRRRVGERSTTLPIADPSASPAPVDRANAAALSEEDQMALAIAESLKASKLDSGVSSGLGSVRSGASAKSASGKSSGGSSSTLKSATQQTTEPDSAANLRKSRGQEEEDAELEAALKASLELAKASGLAEQEEEEEEEESEGDGAEDDTPTIEELRQRRLARFGA